MSKSTLTPPAVKERPILFKGEMVRAILDGSKTQTRRILKPQPVANPDMPGRHWWAADAVRSMVGVEETLCENHPAFSPVWNGLASSLCPHGEKGHRLWVKETFSWNHGVSGFMSKDCWLTYSADNSQRAFDGEEWVRKKGKFPTGNGKWKPSIFMERWMSRLTLEITNVRVERLQDISEADAKAEGVTIKPSAQIASSLVQGIKGPAQLEYYALWESINGKGSWALNPWVWVIEFKKL